MIGAILIFVVYWLLYDGVCIKIVPDNKKLDQENRELRIEVMIKDAQLSEKEKAVSDYKESLKEAI